MERLRGKIELFKKKTQTLYSRVTQRATSPQDYSLKRLLKTAQTIHAVGTSSLTYKDLIQSGRTRTSPDNRHEFHLRLSKPLLVTLFILLWTRYEPKVRKETSLKHFILFPTVPQVIIVVLSVLRFSQFLGFVRSAVSLGS